MEHELKCWPTFYQAVLAGEKTFEIRKGDREFDVDDELWLREWHPVTQEYTGRMCIVMVTYLMAGNWPGFAGLAEGYVAMGIRLKPEDIAA